MSLYHEAAEFLLASPSEGGSLKARVFRNKSLKSPPNQLYALVLETSKWSGVLKEVIENSELLKIEKKLTPALALLLVHDLLLAKRGISLPQSHGLRQAVDRNKGRLSSELTRARLRRRFGSLEDLRSDVERASAGEESLCPRWVRVNALKSSIEEQLETTFAGFERTSSLATVVTARAKHVYIDPHVPDLLGVTQGTDLTKTEAYAAGKIILQDKASCFPAYLLDPGPGDGDVVDACAAPGNKTTHVAAVLRSHRPEFESPAQTVFAFEKDDTRARTLEKMVKVAGARPQTRIGPGQDFLQVDPEDPRYAKVGALLLDPSCSGSGIVGRDSMPEVHLPGAAGGTKATSSFGGTGGATTTTRPGTTSKYNKVTNRAKRKRDEEEDQQQQQQQQQQNVLMDDDGNETVVQSRRDLQTRLEALSAFQLSLLLHAFRFPAARKVTYSTCSVHAEENERVVMRALVSDVARERGWRILRRDEQVSGLRSWPVRGAPEACVGEDTVPTSSNTDEVAEGCIRSYKGDGQGVMGFFVAGFVRAGDEACTEGEDGPYMRDQDGFIVRDVTGMPVLKSTGAPVELVPREDEEEEGRSAEEEDSGENLGDDSDEDDSDTGSEEEEWNGLGD